MASTWRSVAHADFHPIFAACDDSVSETEMRRGRDILAGIVGQPIDTFAYPNGRPGRDYQRRHVEMARALRIPGAVSTARGVAQIGSDAHQLPRFTPWDRSPLRFGLLMLSSLRNTPVRASLARTFHQPIPIMWRWPQANISTNTAAPVERPARLRYAAPARGPLASLQ